MAERANAQETVEVPGASHALPASQPEVVADFILRAAASVRGPAGAGGGELPLRQHRLAAHQRPVLRGRLRSGGQFELLAGEGGRLAVELTQRGVFGGAAAQDAQALVAAAEDDAVVATVRGLEPDLLMRSM